MEDVERKDDTDGWIKIEWKDSYKNKITPLVLTTTNNAFAVLSVSNDPTTKQAAPVAVPSPISCLTDNKTIMFDPKEHRRQRKIARQQHVWQTLRQLRKNDDLFLNNSITITEDKCTNLAKNDDSNAKRKAINSSHVRQDKPSIGLVQRRRNLVYSMSSAFNQTIKKLNKTKQHVSFATHNTVRLCKDHKEHLMITYGSGSNSNYLSKKDCIKAGPPILQPSTRRDGVANQGTSQAQHVTRLPFHKLSARARQADTVQDFPTLSMSVGKTSDNSTISVSTKTGVTVFKEEDVLITCKSKPILIGMQDGRGQYQIPLMQQRGQWQPQCPSKQVRKALRQANSVYNLPSTKQAIKWMHTVCRYPVKLTWLKAIKAGNYVGWPMLTERNIQKYYPEATKTATGHLKQTRKNVCSTKKKPAP
jgi:hypothetical protein